MALDIKKITNTASKLASDALEQAPELAKKVSDTASSTSKKVIDAGSKVAKKGTELVQSSQKAVIDAIDENGNGQIDIEDIIVKGFKTPGVKINRESFLRKELSKHFPEETVNMAIATNPAKAGIDVEEINKIADHVIQFERIGVSGISAALGAPGGAAMVTTIPADIIQFYGYMLRAAQEMLYLYGFPEIGSDDDNGLDSETINIIILCLGTMYGVATAKNALLGLAKALGKGISTKIMKTALTKGTIYPIIKEVSKWFSVKMTKSLLAGVVNKSLPVIGGVVGGAITYASFKPCCIKLKESLSDTMISNPNNISKQSQEDAIDIEFTEV